MDATAVAAVEAAAAAAPYLIVRPAQGRRLEEGGAGLGGAAGISRDGGRPAWTATARTYLCQNHVGAIPSDWRASRSRRRVRCPLAARWDHLPCLVVRESWWGPPRVGSGKWHREAATQTTQDRGEERVSVSQ